MNQLVRFGVHGVLLLLLVSTAGCDKPKDDRNKSTDGKPVRSEVTSDTELTFKIKVALLSDKNVSRFEIKVKTKNGIVWLTGTLENQSQIDYVEKQVRNISGVQSLHNGLTTVT